MQPEWFMAKSLLLLFPTQMRICFRRMFFLVPEKHMAFLDSVLRFWYAFFFWFLRFCFGLNFCLFVFFFFLNFCCWEKKMLKNKIVKFFRKSPKITPSTLNPAKYLFWWLEYIPTHSTKHTGSASWGRGLICTKVGCGVGEKIQPASYVYVRVFFCFFDALWVYLYGAF